MRVTHVVALSKGVNDVRTPKERERLRLRLREGRKTRRGGRRPLSPNDRTVMLGVPVPAAMKEAVSKAADEQGMSTANFVRILIKRFLDAERAKATAPAPTPTPKPQPINHRRANNWWPVSRPVEGGAR